MAGGAGWCRQTRQNFEDMMRAEFECAKAAGDLPPEIQGLDYDLASKQGFGTELPDTVVMKLTLANLFQIYWFVFVVLRLRRLVRNRTLDESESITTGIS